MVYILIFSNTYRALKCEKILNDIKIRLTIVPVPSHITSSCGIGIGINKEDLNDIIKLINDKKIIVKDIYDNINKKKLEDI